MAKRKRNGVHVHVHLPKEYVGAAGRAAGSRLGGAAAGFLIANPLVAIIIIVVGIFVFMFVGGATLMSVFQKLTNVWMWAIVLLIALATKPKDTMIIWAILVGMLFWGYGIYQEYMSYQAICQIPIIGWLMCTGWNMITFLPKLWDLGVTIFVAFGMIYIAEFLRSQITGR